MFLFDPDAEQPPEAYLLAGVSGCDLQNWLEGLFSKSDMMAILEKLLIRWHSISDQIVVAVPFVGHMYLPKPDKMGIWTWLLSLIDPAIGVFSSSAAARNRCEVLSGSATIDREHLVPVDDGGALPGALHRSAQADASGTTVNDFPCAGLKAQWSVPIQAISRIPTGELSCITSSEIPGSVSRNPDPASLS